MEINRLKYESNDKELNFDFDEWVALFKKSPESFEARRLKWSEQLINNAPAACQRRLSGLLFQINMEKRRSKTALASCMRLSGMMWKMLNKLNLELDQLIHHPITSTSCSTKRNTGPTATAVESGLVYAFPSSYKPRES